MSRRPVLFFHVQHLLGIGHQMRAAAIARACGKAGIEVHYATGGFEDRALDLGGAEVHQLPPVRVIGRDFTQMADETGQPIDEDWWRRREAATLEQFGKIDPDLLLIEGYPFARRKFGRELQPVIRAARTRAVPVISSVRDILVPPSNEEKRLRALKVAAEDFDHILVHGDPAFVALEESLIGAQALGPKLSYTGYVDGGSGEDAAPGDNAARDGILVSVGGGAVGASLLALALEAAGKIGETGPHWRLLTGPNLPGDALAQLREKAKGLPITLEAARPDFRQLLAKSRLSISQAGYNTVMDLMAARCPAILIPFGEGGESEQPMRANLLQKAGLALTLEEAGLTADALADAVARMLSRTKPLPAVPFACNGAGKSAQILKDLHEMRGKAK